MVDAETLRMRVFKLIKNPLMAQRARESLFGAPIPEFFFLFAVLVAGFKGTPSLGRRRSGCGVTGSAYDGLAVIEIGIVVGVTSSFLRSVLEAVRE